VDRVNIIQGDITKLKVDAIVNAANTSLLGGGGVDGEIHRTAGRGLLSECRKLNGCETGKAKITKGYNLPANYVIHTVGAVYKDGNHGEWELLYSCYRESLILAEEYGIKTIAFPCISTGAYRFPFREACIIALHAVKDFLRENQSVSRVIMVCFSDEDYAQYVEIYKDFRVKAAAVRRDI